MAIAPDNDPDRPTSSTGRSTPPGPARILPTLLPTCLLLMALVLPRFMFQVDQTASKSGLGPAAWPDAMLLGMAVFCVLWIVRDVWALGATSRKPTLSIPIEHSHYNFDKAIVGLIMIITYGWALPKLGFAISTSVFIMIWCLFSGLRNLLVVIPVTVIGTIVLLWLFMGLALMPLPRGSGPFNDLSVWLLRAIGIY